MESNQSVITLDNPIVRDGQKIEQVTVRKPVAGELRGVSLVDLAQMEVSVLQKVLPRITTPALTAVDLNNMDLADLTQIGIAVAGFLASKSMTESASPQP